MKFEMNAVESVVTNNWIKEHDKECPLLLSGDVGAIGGRITYTFTPTSLGMACGVQCACGAEHACTDVSDW